MNADEPSSSVPLIAAAEARAAVRAFLDREAGADDRLAATLSRCASITVRDFLGRPDRETDDIVQDAVVSVLAWLTRRGEFTGDIISFTITVTRNRCRNYLDWQRSQRTVPLTGQTGYVASGSPGPLDDLVAAERIAHLQAAVDDLDIACRRLLHAIYYEKRKMADLQREAGLGSLQSMYHRRAVCLKKVEKFLKKQWRGCSSRGPAKHGPAKKGPARLDWKGRLHD